MAGQVCCAQYHGNHFPGVLSVHTMECALVWQLQAGQDAKPAGGAVQPGQHFLHELCPAGIFLQQDVALQGGGHQFIVYSLIFD